MAEQETRDNGQGGINRRRFVTGALAATAGAAAGPLWGAEGARAAAPALLKSSVTGRNVAIFGAGMGGLSTAHELAERGFQVTVYERKVLGGKSRSIPVPGTATGGRKDLPGEHGFRFFPGFYQNLPDTMSRIPFGSGTVRDNLVAASLTAIAYRKKFLRVPIPSELSNGLTPEVIQDFLRSAIIAGTTIPLTQINFFLSKMITFITSGPRRKLGQWENMSFSDFTKSDIMSVEYRELLTRMFTASLVAAQPDRANTRTIAMMFEALLYSGLGLGPYGPPDQVLNGPSNDVWINPWIDYLTGLGVQFKVGWSATGFDHSGGRITGARVTDPTGAAGTVTADHYVAAMPIERVMPLLSSSMKSADPQLARLSHLETDWMNGVMIYLKQPTPIVEGHLVYAGTPWALTSISQAQFWTTDFPAAYGDGVAKDCLSIDLSDWNSPGILFGKTAKQCTRPEIVQEVLAQIRAVTPNGNQLLPDSLVHSWFVDPAITGEGTPAVANDEPLLINSPSSWANRPEATTRIPNFYLAADYVRNNINLATMEGGNEAGRKTANAILDAAGSSATKARLYDLYLPKEFKSLYDLDDIRYQLGLPNKFDILAPYWP
ncbi:hydroxysqualene dehydroxylase [Nonomuraea ferruginea]|uniref:FAD-dependent oxidoreductase n=1 Tax=Nonomuraea ferruginea TaxID=46174 RepID=A0ABT4SRI7_9ACTN|nr:FAD-dependent oxidoreductase [Nonomuraea ferruginea]MDA0639872.1 FAD-dependent oxidoreductase [Nonomuraea ferruginea]